jgi:parvulin-like peptidyl-prolyl isomerase
MRKVIVSFVAGILVAIGTSAAYAEVTSMIGKRVDGQFPLKIDGELSEIPAITIEGVSYIPLRAAGELFGAQVSWLDGEIIMEKINKNVGVLPPTAEEMAEVARIEQERLDREAQQRNEIDRQINQLQSEIKTKIIRKQADISAKKATIKEIEEKIEENPEYISVEGPVRYKDTPQYQRDLERTAQLKSEIEAIQNEIDALEAQLAELEQQKAELEAQQ